MDDAYRCRVCGLRLEDPPWGLDGRTPLYDHCPCCGVEFGYQDATPEGARKFRCAWLDRALQERWARYLRLREQNVAYSAFVRLAEIADCVRHADVSAELRAGWGDRLGQVSLSPDELQALQTEAQTKLERLGRIVSVGGKLEYEEAVLVITLRVELALLVAYLAGRGAGDFLDTRSVDAKLVAAVSAPATAAAYRSAQQAARLNWGLPLHSQWLGVSEGS